MDRTTDTKTNAGDDETRPSEVALDAIVRQIASKIYEYEDGLSDGYGYYGGDYSVQCLARDIAEMLPNAQVDAPSGARSAERR